MAEHLTDQRVKALTKNRRRRMWRRVVSALGCLVVFCTVYALVLPAVTASEETFCGKQEHSHTDACYEQVLACGLEEREESVVYGHAHSSSCYQEEQTLLCTLEETEDVLDENGEIIEPGHLHTPECYQVEQLLVCGQEESADQVIEGHTHSDACYKRQMTCGKDEHKHVEKCFIDKNADVETQADWEATLPAASELNGVWAEDVLTVADSQLGYTESKKNYVIDDAVGYNRGWTRYGAWYGNAYGDWCAMFASFCLHYAGVDKDSMPRDAGCQNWISTLKSEDWGLWRPADENGQAWTPAWVVKKQQAEAQAAADEAARSGEGVEPEVAAAAEEATEEAKAQEYTPQPGDLVFFNWDTNEVSDHVGIVYEVIEATATEPAKLKTIEGNSSDCVQYVTYELTDNSIMGYAQLPENPNLVEEEAAKEEAEVKSVRLAAPFALTRAASQGITVHQVNSYDQSQTGTTVVSGGTVGNVLGTSLGFGWWTAIVVEKDSKGLYVSEVHSDRGNGALKTNVGAQTNGGFVLLYYGELTGISVDERVYVDFSYSGTLAYSANGHGTVTFGSIKEEKDNSNKLTVVPSADTSGLIEVNLWDYQANINEKYSSDNKYPGFQQQFGTKEIGSSLTSGSFDFGNSITSDLLAGINGVTSQGGAINAISNGANSPISGAMLTTLKDGYPALADGTSLAYLFSNNTYATKQNGNSINGLFQYNETTGSYTFNSRENHAQFNPGADTFTLYDQVISSNFMMYPFGNFLPLNDIVHQSAQSSTVDQAYIQEIAKSAQYKQNNGYSKTSWNEYGTLASMLNLFDERMVGIYGENWTAYDAVNAYFDKSNIPMQFTESSPEMESGKPVMDYVYTVDYDEETNFYFGMDMKMTFMQPKNGLTGKQGNEPMVFYFTGDDDVWVYVDGVLFLDLSGIHRHVGGEIDFQKGEVRYYSLSKETGDVSTTPYKTVSFAEILGSSESLNANGAFKDYSTHTFNFYYMERGAGSGVCRMNFNFPLLKQNSISVSKEVSTDEGDEELLGSPDYRFQVLQADANGNKTESLFLAANTAYTIYDANDNVIGSGMTDVNGVFTLKAGQRAEFAGIKENAGKYYVRELLTGNEHGQYGSITVSGESTTTNYDVEVGEDVFTGVDSPVKDMSDGATAFRFDNKVTFTKLGSLEMKKTLVDANGQVVQDGTEFQYQVLLDGALLPVGTKYTVKNNATGATQTKTVETQGIVLVPADSTVTISNIVAGTQFVVSETAASSKGYTVTYSGTNNAVVDGSSVAGVITNGEAGTVGVLVTNSENGAAVSIPVEKAIENPDGSEHAFAFDLVQVTGPDGKTVVEDGAAQIATLVVPEGGAVSEASAFVLSYLEKDIDELPATYYYKISEQVDASLTSAVDFDETFYVVEVALTKDGNAFKAQVANVWKNGTEEIADFAAASFSNVLLRDLTIQKKLIVPDGMDTSGLTFDFTVTLSGSQVAENGSFEATKIKADGTSEKLADPIQFTDGKATVTLKGEESLVLHGISYGTTWSVVEAEADGFHAAHQLMPVDASAQAVAGSDTGSQVLTDSATGVVFTNTGGYELPESGGIGTGLHIFCGALAMVGAAVLFVTTRRGKKWFAASFSK